MSHKYAIGVDLGTTNCVLAYAEVDADRPDIRVLGIPQHVGPETVEARDSLPSFLYLPQAHERTDHTFRLPWDTSIEAVPGQLARQQAAEAPDRTVVGAKSWLAQSRVNRHDAILPWKAPSEVPKVSPITASQWYLEHLISAWNQAKQDAPFIEQDVVLTVPASFDASARELTRHAALAAGLPENFVLLEEPQAAVYAWLSAVGDRWREILQLGDTLLVCDVGGGTTDLSVIGVGEENGDLILDRLAVGNHLLIGGDNMDVALAHHVAGLFSQQGVKLNPWQMVSLWHSCRAAKEKLLSPDGPDNHTISVFGRGSKLIGGAVSVEVENKTVRKLLLDGFLPLCEVDERPARGRSSGFQEIGLQFESDTAITRHVAAFLNEHGDGQRPLLPTRILFNGGVFKAQPIRERMLRCFGKWSSDWKPNELEEEVDLHTSVARGATHYAWAKQHGGVRIRGGTPRSYYVGLETTGPAIPGVPRPLNALCVVPMGMEEGTEADVPSDEIGLVVGEPASFRFFSSPTRKEDKLGDVLTEWTAGDLKETDSLETELTADKSIDEPYVPVRFQSKITELGMFELWCVSTRADQRWKLEFNVRYAPDTATP